MPQVIHNPPSRISEITPSFLLYAEVELGFLPQSVAKYRDCFRQIKRMLGDRPVTSLSKDDVLLLKSKMLAKRHSVSRQVSILAALKRILKFSREELNLEVLDPELIAIPKRPRREVVYLTVEEVERFVDAIPLETQRNRPCVAGLRFRVLVEALLGSAMRIGELLSLDRHQVNFGSREAKIIGKGNKQRTVFFTQRATGWLLEYLGTRHDNHPALFVSQGGRSRLAQTDIWRPFARYRRRAGITKTVTPHILRHYLPFRTMSRAHRHNLFLGQLLESYAT